MCLNYVCAVFVRELFALGPCNCEFKMILVAQNKLLPTDMCFSGK